MEMKVKIPKTVFGDVRGCGFTFCATTFIRTLQLDSALRECFIIASVERPDLEDESIFTITKPRTTPSNVSTYSGKELGMKRIAGLKEIRPFFYIGAKMKFAKLYDKGFRYLHVEYDL